MYEWIFFLHKILFKGKISVANFACSVRGMSSFSCTTQLLFVNLFRCLGYCPQAYTYLP